MSNPNHIILPIIKNKVQAQELNVFHSVELILTPQKEVPFSQILVNKKYHSAFRVYKQKKDKKQQKQEEPKKNSNPITVPRNKITYKLKIRGLQSPTINKNNPFLSPSLLDVTYFDPYSAPLFISLSQQDTELPPWCPYIHEKTERMEEEIQVQLQQKIKIEPIHEEEIITKYVELPYQPDDPFIIIKKTLIKKDKTSKIDTLKSKLIKKDKKVAHNETSKRMTIEKYIKTNKPTLVFPKVPVESKNTEMMAQNQIKPSGQNGAQPTAQVSWVETNSTIKPSPPSSFLISRADIMA